jgi:hypothetical protein
MTEWWAFKPVTTAFEKTKKLLLSPFDMWTWIKLIVIMFFVGGATRFGSQFTNIFNSGNNMSGPVGYTNEINNLLSNSNLIMLIIALVLVIVVVVLILAYLKNVFSFVLIKALATGDVHVIKPALDNLGRGLKLFVITLLLGLFTVAVALVFIIIMIACVLIAIKTGVASASAVLIVLLLALVFIAALVLFIAFCLFMTIVTGFIYDFVAPVMFFQGMGAIQACKHVYGLVRKEWKQFGVYVLTRWVVDLCVGIVMTIISIPVVLVYIALLIIGVIVVVAVLKTSVVLAVLAGICIVIGTLIFIAIMLVISMPVSVYLRYFSLDMLKNAEPSAVEYSGKMGTP